MCHNKWGGLVAKESISILGVQGSIPINDMGCGQCWDVDRIFFTYLTSDYYVSLCWNNRWLT